MHPRHPCFGPGPLAFLPALVAVLSAACGNPSAGAADAALPDGAGAATQPDSQTLPDAGGGGWGGDDSGYKPPRLGPEPSDDETLARSEIVRTEGSLLYVLDVVTGVTVFDLSDPAAPERVIQVPLPGQPVSLDVETGVAIAVTSPADQQSQLVVVDVRDRAAPRASTPAMIRGTAYRTARTATSAVVASWVDGYDRWHDNGLSELAVVSLADLAAPAVVREVHDAAFGWLLASEGGVLLFGAPAGTGSDLTVVDATAPDGSLAPRGTAHVEHHTDVPTGGGWRVAERAFPATIRGGIARLGDAVGGGYVTLDLRDPDAPRVLVSGRIPDDLYPYVARIDDDRIMFADEPTHTNGSVLLVDLHDPAAPVVGARITAPGVGWLAGSQLIFASRPARNATPQDLTRRVQSYDVSNVAQPRALATETFSFDEPFDVERDIESVAGDAAGGLALLAAHVSNARGDQLDGLEVLRLDADGAHPAATLRPGLRVGEAVLGPGYAASLSASNLIVVPTPLGAQPPFTTLPVTAPAADVEALPGSVAVLTPGGDRSTDSTVEFHSPDAPTGAPTARLALPDAPQWLRASGSDLYALTGPEAGGQYRVTLIDAADPSAPRVLGSAPAWTGDDRSIWTYLGDDPVQPWWVHRRTLVGAGRTLATAGIDAAGPRLDVLAFDDPAAPQWTSLTLAAPGPVWEGALAVRGATVLGTLVQDDPSSPIGVAFVLQRVDVTDPRHPVALAALPFPGELIDASDDGSILYTAKVVRESTDDWHTFVDALAYDGATTRTLGTVDVGIVFPDVLGHAWRAGTTVYAPHLAVDFADPTAPVVSSAGLPAFVPGDPSLPPDVLLATEAGGLGVFRRNADGTLARLGYARADVGFPATPAYANGRVLVNGGTYGLEPVAAP